VLAPLLAAALLAVSAGRSVEIPSWCIGPFVRDDAADPILKPNPVPEFLCPMTGQAVRWEQDNVFNPAAVVKDGKVYVLYRAEDDSGIGIGAHTSRIGLAFSSDGSHFRTEPVPVLYPAQDDQRRFEWPGGCEDPRVVEGPDGYVMTYTAWNRDTARLSVATSKDLYHWTKRGSAFGDAFNGRFVDTWSKSGSILTTIVGHRLVAARVEGKYWMYWGEGSICAATSNDLVRWTPVLDSGGALLHLLGPRPGLFDSGLAECGPPAVLTRNGIVLIYNGKNGDSDGSPDVGRGAYSAGQALFDAQDPLKLLQRTDRCFFKPERPYEATGQYASGTVFVEGLVFFRNRWRLYYGTADSMVGVAVSR
jgi:predicted GH43/DUF377 family glycosyl hydrolase